MCPYFMLFYVFLLFIYPPNMVFLMISGATPNHIPKSGIWFTSPACRFEIMLLVFAVIFAKTFLERTKNLSTFQELTRGHFCLKKVT